MHTEAGLDGSAELVVLGSAGWVPHAGTGRMTTCLALRLPDALFLFDAGVGLARLSEPRFRRLLPERGVVHLFLSHLHLDHTVGLTFLPGLWRDTPLTIHVPGEPMTGFPAETVLDRLVGPPFFPHRLDGFPMPVTVTEARPGEVMLEGRRVVVRSQQHAGGSLAYRVDDLFAFLTDTVYDPESAGFARGVALLVHEAWTRGEDDPEWLKLGLTSHTSAEDAARVAREAGVRELLLSHLNPLCDEAYFASMLARARQIFPTTFLGADGLERLL